MFPSDPMYPVWLGELFLDRSQVCCIPLDLCSDRKEENKTHTNTVEWKHQELRHPDQEAKETNSPRHEDVSPLIS